MTLTQILQKIKSAFYTKAETDTLLGGKSNTNHNHNSTYLGKTAKAESAKSADSVAWGNVTGKPSTFAPSSHTHDDRYYTESEVNNLLGGKAASNHNHNGTYVPASASCNKNWNWSGQGGQPNWLWGGNDGTNMYVYNPSNFSVNYATSSNYTNWLRTSSHSDHLFHTEWDGGYFWTYVTAGDGGYRAVRVERANSAGTADYASRSTNNGGFYISNYLVYVG